MAREVDKTLKKGRELWRALKCDPVDHKLIRRLLRNDAPVNFREPDVKVRKSSACCISIARSPLCYLSYET